MVVTWGGQKKNLESPNSIVRFGSAVKEKLRRTVKIAYDRKTHCVSAPRGRCSKHGQPARERVHALEAIFNSSKWLLFWKVNQFSTGTTYTLGWPGSTTANLDFRPRAHDGTRTTHTHPHMHTHADRLQFLRVVYWCLVHACPVLRLTSFDSFIMRKETERSAKM